jgi:hypothetical protein
LFVLNKPNSNLHLLLIEHSSAFLQLPMEKPMHDTIREWIAEVLESHPYIMTIAVRQRAKFEGWLKFELAAVAEKHGAQSVEVETASDENGSSRRRFDLSFTFNDCRYDVELKTINSNWRVPGVYNKHRPIKKNLEGIIKDAQKLAYYSAHGIVAFVLFPTPPNDSQWVKYLDRIASELGVSLSEKEHCHTLSVDLGSNQLANLVICTFSVGSSKSSMMSGISTC